ncbi:MAG: DUF4124 domain-containing protein [Gammaproteobacteria bacterium]|nr:DUF4124 domain-containing protein [Gammaproteobacteria bacterium]
MTNHPHPRYKTTMTTLYTRYLPGIMLLIMSCQTASAEIYTWKRADGTVVFSDRPQAEATEIPVPVPQTYASPTAAGDNTRDTDSPPPAEAAAPVSYTQLTIIQPANDATLWDDAGAVTVALSIIPALQPGHRRVLELDGEQQATDNDGLLMLNQVDRGTHLLRALILDPRNKTVMASPTITFHLKQHTVKR